MKKFFKCMLLCCIVCALTACTINNETRYQYTPETRIALSLTTSSPNVVDACYPAPPQDLMGYVISKADLIVEGKIIDGGTIKTAPMPGMELMPKERQLQETTTTYTVLIENIWFGEYKYDTLSLELLGDETWGVSKPHKHDQGIFILKKCLENENYLSVGAEDGIFIKNPPDNKLYAFSPLEDFSTFDGKESEVLYQAVENKLEEFILNGNESRLTGEVGQLYRSQKQEQLQNEKQSNPQEAQ